MCSRGFHTSYDVHIRGPPHFLALLEAALLKLNKKVQLGVPFFVTPLPSIYVYNFYRPLTSNLDIIPTYPSWQHTVGREANTADLPKGTLRALREAFAVSLARTDSMRERK